MRCSKTKTCGKRFRLKRHPDSYVQRSKVMCPECGGMAYSDEKNRQNELAKQRTCHCPNYPFPHRAGSLRFCQQNPRAEEPPTDQEVFDYEACLATPRGA